MAPLWHLSRQSMQATQRLPSIAWFFTSMQAALQLRAQSVQPLHFSLSIVMRNKAKREKNPSTVPTGQMVLQ